MRSKHFPRRTGSDYPIRNLSYVTALGGRTRRHRYFREARSFLAPVAVAIAVEIGIYASFIIRANRDDWHNFILVVAAVACIPMLTAAVLAAFRRHSSPIIATIVITAVWFSVAVSLLSAFRIAISYQALGASLPALIIIMAYANVRFHRTVALRVAMAPFPEASSVAAELGGIPIIEGPNADIGHLEVLLIDPKEHHSDKWSGLLAECYLGGIDIVPWTKYVEVRQGRLDVSSFDISHLAYSPSQILYARCKRFIDVSVVLLTLPLTLFIALLVAAYLGLRDGFPVIFVQIRRGYGGRRFRMYKFRTMYTGSEGGFTGLADVRVIPGCGLIRKFRFDEIPQLYNILIGDMSLIGPRPVAEYVARSSSAIEGKYELRSLVLPGITGWAQVKSGYASTVDEEIVKLSYDLYYIKHLSFDLDVVILFNTIRTVIFGIGAR
jgi:lipopolysaccharide/colanic/teichoic acid biosynthesis glycosyltransferase